MTSKTRHKKNLQVGTINCQLHFSSTDDITSLYQYGLDHEMDVILLQECGHKIPILPNSPYTFYQTPPPSSNIPANHSTAILVRTTLTKHFIDITTHPNGRCTSIQLHIQNRKMRFTSIYFPTNNQIKYDPCGTAEVVLNLHKFLDSNCHSPHHIVGGDFNECYLHERNTKSINNYRPAVIIPTILANQNMSDTSTSDANRNCTPTHYCRRKNTISTARLDRILISTTLSPYVVKETTDSQHHIFSDHHPVLLHLQLPNAPHNNTRKDDFRTKRPFHKLNYQGQSFTTFLKHADERASDLWQSLHTKTPKTITSNTLSSTIELLTNNIYTLAKKHLRTKRHNTNPIPHHIRTRQKSRRALRSLIHTIQTYLTNNLPNTKQFCSLLSKKATYNIHLMHLQGITFPIVDTALAWHDWIVALRQKAAQLRHQIKNLTNAYKCTQQHLQQHTFHKNRSLFYKQMVHCTNKSGKINTIWNDTMGENVTDPTLVKDTLLSEATALLQNPPTPPNDPPEWFTAAYSWNAIKIDHNIWNPLVEKFTIEELRNATNNENIAPGYDGIPARLYHHIIHSTNPPNMPSLLLLRLLNLWYQSGKCPQSQVIGRMVLIPKPGKKPVTHYRNKRPLTMQPEFTKLLLRMLAHRLQNIFHQHDILHPAQTAYIRNGNVDKCLNLLLDQIEISREKHNQLFIVAYDMYKAFDRTPFWLIKLSCDRFGIPPIFQDFTLAYLQTSQTFIDTAYGNTRMFALKNSVKQGCPLAGYLYIMTLDTLHHISNSQPQAITPYFNQPTIQQPNNPTSNTNNSTTHNHADVVITQTNSLTQKLGVHINHTDGSSTSVATLGYADDYSHMATSPDACIIQHKICTTILGTQQT